MNDVVPRFNNGKFCGCPVTEVDVVDLAFIARTGSAQDRLIASLELHRRKARLRAMVHARRLATQHKTR